MPLIACPVCGRNVSDMAQTCPECGHPVAGDPAVVEAQAAAQAGMVEVEFSRPTYFHNKMYGTVYVDGDEVGCSEACSSFSVYLTRGKHKIDIDSWETKRFHQRERSSSKEIDIPRSIRSVRVLLKVQEGLRNLKNGGKCVVVDDVKFI